MGRRHVSGVVMVVSGITLLVMAVIVAMAPTQPLPIPVIVIGIVFIAVGASRLGQDGG